MGLLDNKAIIVCGGAGVVGVEIATFFGERGYSAILLDKNSNKLAEVTGVLEKKHISATGITVDLTSKEQMEKAARDLAGATEQIAILVNAAALKVVQRGGANWQEGAEAVLRGSRNSIYYFSDLLEDASIVNMLPFPEKGTSSGASLYSSLKTGIASLTAVSARKLSGKSVRVNAIVPGFFREIEESMDKELLKSLKEKIPAQRLGSISELAELVLFLSSKSGKYINGAQIPIDGGFFS